MSAFVVRVADVKAYGEPWADTETLDEYYSRDEGGSVRLVHRSEGYDPKGAEYTRWTPEQWGIVWPNEQARWFDAKRDALTQFNLLKRAGE